MLLQVLILLIIVHLQKVIQLLLILPLFLCFHADDLHLFTYLCHFLRFHPFRILSALSGERFRCIFRVGIIRIDPLPEMLSIIIAFIHYLLCLFHNTVQFELAFSIILVRVDVLSGITLACLDFVYLGIPKRSVFPENVRRCAVILRGLAQNL